MGCLFAAKLAEAGNQVLLVDHDPKTVSAIRKNGIRIREGKRQRRVLVPIRKSLGNLTSCDLVLVMVKAYSTKLVARELRGKIGRRSTILTLQNGLGNMEVLSQSLGNRVLSGSTTEASLRLGPGRVEHTGKGATLVGAMTSSHSGRVVEVVRLLRGAGFATLMSEHVKSVVWSKTVLNSAINPVSALIRLRNGQLGRVRGLRELMLAVLEEGVRVGRAEGVTLNFAYLSGLLSKVLRSTAQNRSSMLQDVMNGRKTEVRELNGMIAGLGRRHGIEAPLNNLLLTLVVGLEASYAPGIS